MNSAALVAATLHHDHSIGEQDRFFEIVCHIHHRVLAPLPIPYEFLLQREFRQRIQRAERLIHQEVLCVSEKRARDVRALSHPGGNLVWKQVEAGAQTESLEDVTCPLPSLAPARAAKTKSE